ncbi:DUF3775 domain-containing protein [Scatolibacter rhodanostii]|uniref:DUF3775 domain-containing protein n=1 Tax=Scatolibacter rhodanostii TaxID=2014781 RepID=UPI000C0810E2|nr:DUF3775 domain-containing protein [Scatolibacter rhodanostii]
MVSTQTIDTVIKLAEDNPASLNPYLENLSFNDLLDLEALMYIGRGDANEAQNETKEKTFADMRWHVRNLVRNEKDKWQIEEQISGKIHLAQYLKKGKSFLYL